MKMSYEKYKSLVSSETLKFTNQVLDYLYTYTDYSISSNEKEFPNNSSESNYLNIFLHVLSIPEEYDKYKELFASRDMLRMDFDRIPVQKPKDYGKLFNRYSELFLIEDDEYEYFSLTPLSLLYNVVEKFLLSRSWKNEWIKFLFGSKAELLNFRDRISLINDRVMKTNRDQLEDETLSDLSPNVREYLMKASIILDELIEHYQDSEKIQDIEKDSIPLALLLSLCYSEDLEKDSFGVSKSSITMDMLYEMGVDLDETSVDRIFDYDFNNEYYPDIYYVAYLFGKYFNEGIYAGKDKKRVTVSGIIENVLIGKLNETDILKRLIADYKLSTFRGLSKKVEHEFRRQSEEAADKYVEPLYKDMRNDTKMYLEMATKIYTLIKERMENDSHNISVLNVDDDIDTLSLFIASFYFNLDVARFYKLHNITPEKVLEFLKLDITREEIEKCPLDRKTLVDVFTRFVKEGVNKSSKIQNITPNDVNYNLCNREFNRTTIMEDIFYHFTSNLMIESDFLGHLQKDLENQRLKEKAIREEQERKEREKQINELFDGMDKDTINFLKRVSSIYQAISHCNYNNHDPKLFALLFALINYSEDKTIHNVLVRNNLDASTWVHSVNYHDSFCTYIFSKKEEKDCDGFSFRIDILLDNFKDFIIDSETGRKRTIPEMLKLIPVLCDKDEVDKLIKAEKNNSDLFTNIERKISEYKKQDAIAKREQKASSTFRYYNQSYIFANAIRIIEYLRKENPNVVPEEQLPDLSVLLGILKSEAGTYFNKNNLTLKRVCDLLGIDANAIEKLNDNVQYYRHLKDYKRYLANLESNYLDLTYLMTRFFEDNSILGEIVERLNGIEGEEKIDFDVLKIEAINQKEYMQTLSIPERARVLADYEFKPIVFDETNSAILFGQEIDVHFNYISNELANIIGKSTSTESIHSVQESLAKVFNVKLGDKGESIEVLAAKISRKLNGRNMFMRVLHKSNDDMALSPEDFDNVIRLMQQQIEVLRGEIDQYDELSKYLEGVCSKNIERMALANAYLEESNKIIQTLNPDPSSRDFPRYSRQTTMSKVISNALKRFVQSDANIKQTLARINVAMYTHSIIINALEMAINTIIPLICVELSIHDGNKSERNALVISNKLVNVYQQLLVQNTSKALVNMEQLKKYQLPENAQVLLENLDSKVSGYVADVDNLKKRKVLPGAEIRID